MKLKQAILDVLGRDTLRAIVEGLELDDVDRRSVTDMAASLSRAHRATAEEMLDFLSEVEVKAVCERYGRSTRGRRAELIVKLLDHDQRQLGRRAAVRETDAAAAPEKEPAPIARKESTNMDDPAPLPPPPPPRVERLPDPPPGMLRVTRTELVWPGKYDDDGTRKEVPRVSLPFQVIETIHESRATRQTKRDRSSTLFDIWDAKEGDTFEDGWHNKLIWGDNLLVMGALLDKLAGKVDLIYIDPPFATGQDFSFEVEIGEHTVIKEPSLVEEKAYRDTWGRALSSYLQMVYDRINLARELLAETGSLYVHIGPGIGTYVKAMCDEVFGEQAQANEIVWQRVTAHGDSQRWGIIHDYILWVTKSRAYCWNPQYVPYSQEYLESKYRRKTQDGRIYRLDNLTSPHPRPNMTYVWRSHQPPKYGWRYSNSRSRRGVRSAASQARGAFRTS